MSKVPQNKCIVFPHIPKCGGTSLKQHFEASNLKVFFDYEFPPHNRMNYYKNRCERRNWESSLLDFSNFDLVFGHFPINRYKNENGNYSYVTLMRDPYERVVSQYFYFRNRPTENIDKKKSKNTFALEVNSGEMGIVEFVRRKSIDVMYQAYLSDFTPSDFLLVGFTDQYDHFLTRLGNLLGYGFGPSIHARKGEKDALSPKEEKKVREILKGSSEYYEEFRQHWSA